MPIENLQLEVPAKKNNFPPLDAGVYQVQLQDIKEILKAPYGAPPLSIKSVPFLTFEFTILDEGEARGRRLWKDVKPVAPVPPVDGKKAAKSWEIISALVKHSLTLEEGLTYTSSMFNDFIGKQLTVVVSQKPPKADGRIYNDISAFTSAKKDMSPYTLEEAEALRASLNQDINVADIPF